MNGFGHKTLISQTKSIWDLAVPYLENLEKISVGHHVLRFTYTLTIAMTTTVEEAVCDARPLGAFVLHHVFIYCY